MKYIDSVIKTIAFSDYNLLNETQWDSKDLKTHFFCVYNKLNVRYNWQFIINITHTTYKTEYCNVILKDAT